MSFFKFCTETTQWYICYNEETVEDILFKCEQINRVWHQLLPSLCLKQLDTGHLTFCCKNAQQWIISLILNKFLKDYNITLYF